MSIDERVSVSQIQKAVKSLSSYAASKKKEIQESGKVLFDDEDENVWLVVTTKTMSPSLTLKPQRIPLAHPIVDPRVSSICLITKDPQRAYKDLLQKQNIGFISRVVGITKLKGKFSPYDARRQLAGDHGLFLADERIIPLLPKLLGKAFFKKKKQPIPVNLLKKDLKAELESAISSTYMHQNAGTSLAIKMGHTGMDARKLVANIEKATPAVARKLYAVNKRRKSGEKNKPVVVKESMKSEEEKIQEREEAWENIQSLGIKTHSSVCLPIWSCSLSERWIASAPAAAPVSNGKVSTNGISKGSKPIEREDEEDDTMSEGDDSDEKRLSNKLAKSSLNPSKKPAKRPAEESQPDARKKKRKADDERAEDGLTSTDAPSKKSKTTSADSLSTASKKPKEKSSAPVEAPSTTKAPTEKPRKAERVKAADLMDEDLPSPPQNEQKQKKKDETSPFAAADANLKAHKKDKKRDKVLAESGAAAMMQDTTLPVIKSGTSTPFAAADASLKAHKKAKKAEKGSDGATVVEKANEVVPSKENSNTSKPVSTPPSTTPLKSALKKSSTSAAGPGSGPTPSELSEKKAKKATFSVVEKKKEKISKGVIGGVSGAKSGKGGKSKASLVGRGPKM
ncbi:hypothetical protein M408DRAFT_10855 [Serendipita vermifera MAFF 305830]|uniref:Ribosomal L1 domain-containing protein 1 n=1 Tax=Serendipita vermifera MAFF 305830 TaxID=933852 RepID=A0A0C3AZP5_SERVB|nr:hypothetical protein M408DRAFT_10855 [Serendipita vermifera MAFF 305830]